jgi:hypothetical protein
MRRGVFTAIAAWYVARCQSLSHLRPTRYQGKWRLIRSCKPLRNSRKICARSARQRASHGDPAKLALGGGRQDGPPGPDIDAQAYLAAPTKGDISSARYRALIGGLCFGLSSAYLFFGVGVLHIQYPSVSWKRMQGRQSSARDERHWCIVRVLRYRARTIRGLCDVYCLCGEFRGTSRLGTSWGGEQNQSRIWPAPMLRRWSARKGPRFATPLCL